MLSSLASHSVQVEILGEPGHVVLMIDNHFTITIPLVAGTLIQDGKARLLEIDFSSVKNGGCVVRVDRVVTKQVVQKLQICLQLSVEVETDV